MLTPQVERLPDDLLGLLLHEYQKSVNQELQDAPDDLDRLTLRAELEKGRVGVERFVAFAKQYLDENRPVGISHAVDQNYLITLRNRMTVHIAPSTPTGDIIQSESVSCVRHASQSG